MTEQIVEQKPKVTEKILYTAHCGQLEFHDCKARFRCLACGRRWGKTLCGANEFLIMMQDAGPNAVGFCVAPTYWHTQKQWETILLYCPREIVVDINRAEHHIVLTENRHVWFKSADNPDSLRSQGLNVLWVDEGGQMSEEAWTLGLRPALMDRHGRAIFTGTPKGHNWYWLLWLKGQDPKESEYKSWTFPSINNPYLKQQEIDDFARDMPELAYRQELLGEFLEDVGAVFHGIEACVKGELQLPMAKTYMMGVDLAKTYDFTVITVLDHDGHLVYFQRFGALDWHVQIQRAVEVARRYKARVLIDSTGLGDPVFDEFRHLYPSVFGYKIKTAALKEDLVENLALMIEQGKITFPGAMKGSLYTGPVPELFNELKVYGYSKTPSGTIQYGAPSGLHDDCVISLALAAWNIRRPTGYFI